MSIWKIIFRVSQKKIAPSSLEPSPLSKSESITVLQSSQTLNKDENITSSVPHAGDVFIMPLDNGLFGACRIIRSGDPARRDPMEYMRSFGAMKNFSPNIICIFTRRLTRRPLGRI